MNWAKGIILSFVLFALFIGTLVIVCIRQEVNLVSTNYYEEELDYQRQIERIQNVHSLEVKPDIVLVGQSLEVTFNQFSALENGEVKLFRPSDKALDRVFSLRNSVQTTQQFDVSGLPAGLYYARMKWTMNGKEYFLEKVISI